MVQLVWEEVKKQGFSLVVLCMAIWFFYTENQRIQAKVDACVEEQIATLKIVIENNTESTLEIKKLIKHLGGFDDYQPNDNKRNGKKGN